METAKIAEYYDVTLGSYQKHWYKDSSSYSLHYGLWEKGTKSLHEAFINTNKFLAETAAIKAGDVVLDAGCGVGGSSIWLAKTVGCKAVGVTVSPKQQREATRLAKENGVEHLAEFYVKDFTNTGFDSESFDVVWGLESICYADNKLDFLKEAFRLLKKGGRIAVCDGFKQRDPQNREEEINLQRYEEGFALPAVSSIEGFRRDLEAAGFQNIRYWDKIEQVTPSSKRIYNMCRVTYPLIKLVKRFKLQSRSLQVLDKNAEAGIAQYKLVKSGLAGYGLFYAEK